MENNNNVNCNQVKEIDRDSINEISSTVLKIGYTENFITVYEVVEAPSPCVKIVGDM